MTGDGNRLLSDGTYAYTYDEDGNRTARFIDVDEDGVLDTGDTDITQCAWDSRHRLVEATDRATFGGDPTQIVAYVYDVENRLVGEKVDSNGDGVVDHQTRFVYDGNQIVLQFDKNGTGDVTGANLSHRYLWGPAVDQVLADEHVTSSQAAGSVVWPLADQLGTVRDLAVHDSQTGDTSVANHRVYDSFGVLKSQTNAAVDLVFGFTGRPYDKATGLQNNTNRWYDANTGRWISPDPIGSVAGDSNLYGYVGNGPTNATDPSGLADWGSVEWFKQLPGHPDVIISTMGGRVIKVTIKDFGTYGSIQAAQAAWMNAVASFGATHVPSSASAVPTEAQALASMGVKPKPTGTVGTAVGTTAAMLAPLLIDLGGSYLNNITTKVNEYGESEGILDRTIGSGPLHMLDNINAAFGGDPYYFRHKGRGHWWGDH